MLTLSKEQVWQSIERQVSQTVDSLGKRIDSGIMTTVIALNVNAIHTTASCEGHLDWGAPYPWVDIGSGNPRIDDLEQQIAELLSEGKRRSEEIKQLDLQVRHIHFQEEKKLVEALEYFYQLAPIRYDRHLVFVHDIRGGCRVQSQGADTQEARSLDERAAKLKEYQQEMQAFADFLQAKFFGESLSPVREEYTTLEAAQILGVEHQTVVRNIHRGNLAAEKRGRDYIIRAAEFERFKNTPRRSGRPCAAKGES